MTPDQFTTRRLSIRNWRLDIADAQRRRALGIELASVLTAAVLEHLPPSMQLTSGAVGMEDWIEARLAECDILLVRRAQDDHLIGLMILSSDPEAIDPMTIHLGYLLAESAWGQGYVSELLMGLLSAFPPGSSVRLVAGVERNNPASVRVLQKAGFSPMPEQSSATSEMFSRELG